MHVFAASSPHVATPLSELTPRALTHRIRVQRRVYVTVGRLSDYERGSGAARLSDGVHLHVHARLLRARHVKRCRDGGAHVRT